MEKELIINISFNKQREPVFTLQHDDGNSLLDNSDVFNVKLSTTAKLVKIQNKTWDNGSFKLENLKVYEYKEVAGGKRLVSTARYEIGKSFYLKLDEIPTTSDSPARINMMIVDFKHVNCSITFNYYETTSDLIRATTESNLLDEDPGDSTAVAIEDEFTITVPDSAGVASSPETNLAGEDNGVGFGVWLSVLIAVVILVVIAILRLRRKSDGHGKINQKDSDTVVIPDKTEQESKEPDMPATAIVMVDEPVTYSVPKPKPRTFEQPKPRQFELQKPIVYEQPKVVETAFATDSPVIRSNVPLSSNKSFIGIADILDKLLYESSHTCGNAYSNLLTHINMGYLNFRHQVEEIDSAEDSQNAILSQFGNSYNWLCEVVRLSAYLKADESMRDMCACVKLDHKMIETVYANMSTVCEDYGIRLVVPALFRDMYIRSRYISLNTPLITKFIPQEFRSHAHFVEGTIYDVLQPGCVVSTGEVKLPVVCYIHDNKDI